MILRLMLLSLFALSSMLFAKPAIDYSCQFCTRTQLDSLNMIINPIRINQVGYKSNDNHKKAFVADPAASAAGIFKLLNLQTGTIDYTGTLKSIGNYAALDGTFEIRTYWNSITPIGANNLITTGDGKENLYEAKFGDFTKEGRYKILVGQDTSAQFEIRDDVYNSLIETVLHFFGIQRSGDEDSWFHPPSHTLDGSALGPGREGSLMGGWYDCGDHFKVSQNVAYTFSNLMMAYTFWPEKSEDRYGSSYNDTLPFGADGIPDILREAKVGADFVYRLYKESKKDGLIAQNDMYQQVGVDGFDHAFWDRPEKQDAQPRTKGGPDRPVDAGTAVDIGGQYVAGLALFAKSYEPYDPAYAAELKAASIDIYENVVLANFKKGNFQSFADGSFYPKQGRWDDDFAMGTLAMWYLTNDAKYQNILYKDQTIGSNPNAQWNFDTFVAGALQSQKELFSAGGWVYDYQNTHIHVVWAMYRLFFATDALAAKWGVAPAEAAEMRLRIKKVIKERHMAESGSGTDVYGGINDLKVTAPYNLRRTDIAWGLNRYNFGALLPVVAYYDILRNEDPAAAQPYYEVIMDNMNYTLGMNPWDLSFVVGAGTKNLNHPHHRAANPEGYNAGGIPYEYRKPIGAFMAGVAPGETMVDVWDQWTKTETCVDYAAQLILVSQLMAKDLPPDFDGPKRSNVVVDPIDQTSAYINWEVDEISRDTIYISKDPGGTIIQTVPAGDLAKTHSVLVEGLTASSTYYFYISGSDIYKNSKIEDNHGAWYSFKTTAAPLPPAQASDVRICNVTDNSATIYWWTPDFATTSSVAFGTDPANISQTVVGDDSGLPTRFHSVTLNNLQPNTDYYADVISGATKDDNSGLHYPFKTTVRFVDMSIYIKPIFTAGRMKYFINVGNNDTQPFTGLELRYYYQAPDASSYQPQAAYSQIFDEGGMASGTVVSVGAPTAVTGTSYYYIPITIKDKIPVSGRAEIQIEMLKANWVSIPMQDFIDDWSVAANLIPVQFGGLDFTHAADFSGPDFVEKVDGVNVLTYAKTPYITAHHQGVHIYGYPPNYTSNIPNSHRDVNLFFESPLITPATSVEIDSFRVDFTGRAWAKPDGNIDLVQLDGVKINQTPINSMVDSIRFNTSVENLKLGAKYYDFVAWHNSSQPNCACEHQRITIDVDTVVVPVETRYIHTSPIDTLTTYVNRRIPVTFTLSDEPNGSAIDEKITLLLATQLPGIEFYSTATSDKAIAEISLEKGTITVYMMGTLVSDNQLIVRGKGGPEGYLYVPAETPIKVLELPPYPIIDQATMLDEDCNGSPDHMRVLINQKYTAGQSLKGISFTLEGDSVFVPESQITRTQDTILSFSIGGDYKVNGSPKGKAILFNTIDAKEVQFSIDYVDAIGPTAISAAVYENLNPGVDPDSVLVQFSEAIRAPGLQFPFAIKDGNGIDKTVDFSVTANQQIDAERNIWMFALEPKAGSSIIKPDDIIQLNSAAPIFDLLDNQTGACGHANLKVLIKYRPVPMKSASIFDKDFNGQGDQVKVSFERKLRPIDLMDSLNIIWGPQGKDSIFTQSWTSQDSISWTADLASSLSKKTTMGAEDKGNGMLWQFKGEGAAFEKTFILLYDSIPPVISYGRLAKGRLFDTLLVDLSEPVDELAGSDRPFVRKRDGDVPLIPEISKKSSNSQWTYNMIETSQGYSAPGDSLKFNPDELRIIDQNQNQAHVKNPYAPVVGSISVPKIKIKVNPTQSVYKEFEFEENTYSEQDYLSKDLILLAQDFLTGEWYSINSKGETLAQGKNPAIAGMTFEIDLLNLPIIGGKNAQNETRSGGRKDSGFEGQPIYDINIDLRFNIFDQLGQYVRKLEASIFIDNPNFIDLAGNAKFLLQWVGPQNKGLTDEIGRQIATGVLIEQILFDAKVKLHEDYGTFKAGETTKSDDELIKKLGYIRSH